jgi:hypothetical protein
MRRIVVCLLIALASATVAARESKLADADGGSCPSQETRASATRLRDPAPMAVPTKKTRPSLPTSNSGGGDDVRLQSPRWHRFLPGMFR